MRKKIFVLLFMLLFAAGCAKNPAPENRAAYYPGCREPLDYISQRGGMGRSIGGGALQGGLIGLISAAVYGAITGRGDPAHIAGSVGAGMAVGGTVGAIHNRSSKEDNRRLAAWLEQIDGNIEGLDDVVRAGATLALQCYDKNFARLLAEMEKRQMDAQGAKDRFAEIVRGREEACALLNRPPETGKLEARFEKALGK